LGRARPPSRSLNHVAAASTSTGNDFADPTEDRYGAAAPPDGEAAPPPAGADPAAVLPVGAAPVPLTAPPPVGAEAPPEGVAEAGELLLTGAPVLPAPVPVLPAAAPVLPALPPDAELLEFVEVPVCVVLVPVEVVPDWSSALVSFGGTTLGVELGITSAVPPELPHAVRARANSAARTAAIATRRATLTIRGVACDARSADSR
jgi:hypothetical protein